MLAYCSVWERKCLCTTYLSAAWKKKWSPSLVHNKVQIICSFYLWHSVCVIVIFHKIFFTLSLAADLFYSIIIFFKVFIYYKHKEIAQLIYGSVLYVTSRVVAIQLVSWYSFSPLHRLIFMNNLTNVSMLLLKLSPVTDSKVILIADKAEIVHSNEQLK